MRTGVIWNAEVQRAGAGMSDVVQELVVDTPRPATFFPRALNRRPDDSLNPRSKHNGIGSSGYPVGCPHVSGRLYSNAYCSCRLRSG